MNKSLLLYFFFSLTVLVVHGQQDTTGTGMQKEIAKQNAVKADDPSQFITRIEVFNELQHYNKFNRYRLGLQYQQVQSPYHRR